MDDTDVIDLVHQDLLAWAECGCPLDTDPRIAAYQSALSLVVELRKALGSEVKDLSLLAIAMQREDECEGACRVLGRLRGAARRAVSDPNISTGARAALQLALE